MPIMSGTRVKETSTTTGTGNYTLSGAEAGFNSFSAEFGVSASSLFPYVAFDEATNDYECGIGNLTGASTMVRTAVFASTNGDAAVNWAAGTRTIICALAGYQQFAGRHKFDATAPPTIANNYTEGYAAGSLWYSSVGNVLYICGTGGDSGASDGIWIQAGDLKGLNYDADGNCHILNDQYGILGADPWGAVAIAGTNARLHTAYALVLNAQSATQNYDHSGEAQVERVPLVGPTTNATPRVLQHDGYGYMHVPEACIRRYSGTVLARNHANGDAKQWTVGITVQRLGSGNVTAVIAASVVEDYEAAGATAWALGITLNTTEQSVDVTATGVAATDITWYGAFEIVHLGVGVAL